MLELITKDVLLEANVTVGGPGKTYSDPMACVSSAHYYSDPAQQIASVYASLVKGHYFLDGNKRTAVAILFYLNEFARLKVVDDNRLFDITVRVASSSAPNIEQLAQELFPQ